MNSNTQNLINQDFLLLKIIKQSMITMHPLIKITENQLMIILAIVTSVVKSLIKNYLIALQMIIAKTIADKNHQNNTNSFNNSRTIQYDVS